MLGRTLLAAAPILTLVSSNCPGYSQYAQQRHEPFSTGGHNLSYMRPSPECRTFNSSAVEDAIKMLKGEIGDPDLFRLFENTFPNTIDTCIKWRGVAANNSEEELAFIITGDINAMWVRDSANQIAPYKAVLKDKKDDIASIFRGALNLQARYLIQSPYCNAFQPPPESGMNRNTNGGRYRVTPSYDDNVVYTCNFELDDWGGFLQLSHDYFNKTQDLDFFSKFQWTHAIQSILSAARAMQQPTYGPDGEWIPPAYSFQSYTMSAAGTQGNNGFNSPVNYTGMVRSPFRPSDDSAIYDFGIAANMMLARYLESTSSIMSKLPNAPQGLAKEMIDMAAEVSNGIEQFGIVPGPKGQKIYAYEVDGYGGRNLMDDANIPSLLSAPYLGYLDKYDQTYLRTRAFVLSRSNPWYCSGSVISAIGSPHIRPCAVWPMSKIMQAMTTDDYWEVVGAIKEVLGSTNGLGLIHESVDANDESNWSRQWFTWANGLFGQLIMELWERNPDILRERFQPFRYDIKTVRSAP
ncbi:hypothetical protein LTR37_015296 [Vermiconidia calcicola]|uniref:Uncharacterized protein n=1 Tax=Vermiconidia calcicola TaxID=1690605 RepID=A0ACC3MR43_9PEZI|nr:hypothetical protein LTR37_015296 [Vermiconidia calcicola]